MVSLYQKIQLTLTSSQAQRSEGTKPENPSGSVSRISTSQLLLGTQCTILHNLQELRITHTCALDAALYINSYFRPELQTGWDL